MSDYACPQCETEYDATGSHEDDAGEHYCTSCGFKFVVEIEYEPTYFTCCVKCEYGPIEAISAAHYGQRCKHCQNVNPDTLTVAIPGEDK